MKPNASRLGRAAGLLLPLLLATACASVPPPLPPLVVPPAAIPSLPAQARQPTTPAECSPTCSDGWKRLVESLLQKPTAAALPAGPANGLTER